MTDQHKHTDLSKRLRTLCDLLTKDDRGQVAVQVKTLLEAADEIDRYHTGMLNWKASAEEKDAKIIDLRARIAELEAAALAAQPVQPVVPQELLSNEKIRETMHNYSRMVQPGYYSDTEFDCLQDVIGFVRECIELSRPTAPDAAAVRDAERYRWLRMQDWFDGSLCVLKDPKRVLTRGNGLGADCPSRDRLDSAIDAALAASPTATKEPQ